MIIQNDAFVDIWVDSCNKIESGTRGEFSEMMFNTENIHSQIGSVIITTEYGQRSFMEFEDLKCRVLDETDSQGMRVISIYQEPRPVWIVTYWDDDEEPTVTVFDNEEAARSCYEYFKSHVNQHKGCCIDKEDICCKFKVM